jgi:hypothetical protein
MLADNILSPNPQTSRLNDFDLDAVQQGEALMFLIHFLGDIHQPLHTEDMDKGGNDIPVCFDRDCSDMNLHSVWDTEIPNKHRGVARHIRPPAKKEAVEKEAAASWAEDLHAANQAKGLAMSKECGDIQKAQRCALSWANEANSHVCSYVISQLTHDDLGGQYYDGAVPIVDELIGKAGLRLGRWINALAAARSNEANLLVQEL